MLTNSQKGLLKRAQAQASLSDADYRDALECVAGVSSSTDPALGDDHLDVLMAYFEAIYWRGVDAGTLQASCKGSAPFRQRDYWAAKNPARNTSRDRWLDAWTEEAIERLEGELLATGVGAGYLVAIKTRVREGTAEKWTPPQWRAYGAALERSLMARRAKVAKGV